MFDRHMRPMIERRLAHMATALAHRHVSANWLTGAGVVAGLLAALSVAEGAFWAGLALGALSRLLDGLDGMVARLNSPGPIGGYLDILADFTVFAALPIGFAVVAPATNALPAVFLLASFFVNAASFLGFAILAEQFGKRSRLNGEKSHFHATGLIEGTETIVFFGLCMIWPAGFAVLAPTFAVLTLLTAIARVRRAWQMFAD